MVDDEQAYRLATANRLLAAEMLGGLDDAQWSTPSLCLDWTVREVAAHLLSPLESDIGVVGLVVALVRHRGSLHRMVDADARRAARRPTAEIVAGLRERAEVRSDPPVIGPMGPTSDSFIHLRDMARPLGLDVSPPPEAWRYVLDFLVDPSSTTRGFVPKGALAGLRLEASDQDWAHGDGPTVRGSSEAITLAATGRSVALDDLDGDGVDVLRARTAPRG